MGPLLTMLTKLEARRQLRRQGFSFHDINEAFELAGDEAIPAAVKMAKAEEGVAALGDGTILQAILDFLKSEQGQAIIAALVKILLAALAV